jgi:ferredoxin
MSYLVEIDEGACAAHGDCVEVALGVFEVDDVARVIGTADDAVVLSAAEACPSIRIIDPDTDEQIYP